MIRNNVFIAISLSLLCVASAIGSENKKPSSQEICTKIATTGCLGGLGGMILFGLAKASRSPFSKDDLKGDLTLVFISGGIGFFAGIAVETINVIKEHNLRIDNVEQPAKPMSHSKPNIIKFNLYPDSSIRKVNFYSDQKKLTTIIE